ncbi:hypothetical protein Daus18300_003828 [Diaporthe australafricana]|uniref:Uncharacterized protein n=1 Tax=Diaporthe australafricana TaxID=127596 RepID=A0ABR3XDC8_9PEZI
MDDPPVMNWIYIDRQTYEVKFGTRDLAEPNFKVPFDCTRQDRRLTLGGWEGFFAVEEEDFWALYFDVENDRLQSKIPEGTPVLEIELQRIEMKTPKPEIPKQEANGHSEKEGEQQNTTTKPVSLDSPEVD